MTDFQTHLVEFLEATFPNVAWDDSVEDTASRWIKAMQEYTPPSSPDYNFTTFETTVNQLIAVLNIEFSSLCAHHLFPFWGVAHVGYIPNKKMVGISKIPRLVHYLSERPQTQETLTREIASALKHGLDAMGVAVQIESRHTCMSCRGVKQRNAVMVTSEMRGVFLTAEAARLEFLQIVSQGRLR
jgi:GTP cyclohydrolase I